MSPSRIMQWHLTLIVLVSTAAHGLLLIMDGVYWDGRVLYSHLLTRNWPALNDWFSQAGLMFLAEFYWAVGLLPGIVPGYRIGAFMATILASVVTYLICRESKMLSPWEALFISLIQVTFPAFRVRFCIILLPYLVCYLLFLLGALLAMKAYAAPGLARGVLRAVSLICLFLSYTYNSFLVFHFGFLLLMILVVRRAKSLSFLLATKSYLVKNVDYVLLPLLYWRIKEVLYPRHGLYADYNAVVLGMNGLVRGTMEFFVNAIVLELNSAIALLLGTPLLPMVLLVVLLFLSSRSIPAAGSVFGTESPAGRMAGFGGILLALGITPYVLVGKSVTGTLWNSRQSILVSMGLAVVLVACAKGFGVGARGRLARPAVALLAMLVLAFTTTTVKNYMDWQTRWAKDSSIMLHLRALPPSKANTYWIDDGLPLPGQQQYSDYEWSSIFKDAWGGETRTGLRFENERDRALAEYVQRFTPTFDRQHNLSDYDPNGPQAVLTIRPGRAFKNDVTLAARYWYYKFLNSKEFKRWLHGLTEIDVRILPEHTANTS